MASAETQLAAFFPEGGEAAPILALYGFGVAIGEKIILAEVDLEVPERGAVTLMGPCGTGKSTLLRTLAGFNDANPSLRMWGEAYYLGARLTMVERPALVGQNARLMMSSVLENIVHQLPERSNLSIGKQRSLAKRLLARAGIPELGDSLDELVVNLPLAIQRHLSILRQTVAGPRLLCIDEPTTGLDEQDSYRLLDYLREEAKNRALLVVLHNQQYARHLGGQAVLLAGGRVQEHQHVDAFLESPLSIPAREFVRSGTCTVASPDAVLEELDEATPPPRPLPDAARSYVSDAFGPRGFLWLKKGVLAGTPLPGVFHDVEYDLQALKRVGVTTLVTLTESPMDREILARHGISNIWEPIPDMHAPTMDQAKLLCQRLEESARDGETVAVHCYAGLGRTGTVLAATLIWEGMGALDALETVRRIEPRWVQSDAQVTFLEEFAHLVANRAHVEPHMT